MCSRFRESDLFVVKTVLNNGRAETQVCSSKQGTDKLNRQILANVVNLLKTSVCAACASNSFVNVNTEI